MHPQRRRSIGSPLISHGPVGPGALDADGLDGLEGLEGLDGTERRQERQQPPVAHRGRWERVRAQDRTERVAGGSDVDVGMGVHASDDAPGRDGTVVMPVLSMQMSRSGTHTPAVGQDTDWAS